MAGSMAQSMRMTQPAVEPGALAGRGEHLGLAGRRAH
jgi:hypothetical protein